MTRLEQALRWWRNNDGVPTPFRHFRALDNAGFLQPPDEHDEHDLNDAGQKALRAEGGERGDG